MSTDSVMNVPSGIQEGSRVGRAWAGIGGSPWAVVESCCDQPSLHARPG